MSMSPANVRAVQFKQAKRGYDQGEVDAFVAQLAVALVSAQHDTTAMEARARAAVARLEELSQSGDATSTPAREITSDESETISRTPSRSWTYSSMSPTWSWNASYVQPSTGRPRYTPMILPRTPA